MSEDDDGFLGRWSRRKRAAEAAQPVPAAAPPAEPDPPPAPAAEPAPLSEEELAALPRIEDLVEGSDITAFLRPGVPRALKNAALRRIWMATPAIRDYRDPAVDYAWDWNTPGGVPGDGCAPSPEVAARMLRDLVTPRARTVPPEGAADPAADPAPAPAEAPPPVADGAAEEPPEKTPPTAAPAPDRAADVAAEPGPAPAPEPARRRHGSALPS